MTEFLQSLNNFHFIRPWWLLSLVPAFTILIILAKMKGQNNSWSGIISKQLLPYLLVEQASRQAKAPLYLLGLVWLLIIIALAGPAWEKIPQPLEQKIQARVIVLDLSLSMHSNDIQPKRYIRAKHKLSDLLKAYQEGETALIVYSGDAHVVTPLTDDTNTIANLVPSLMPEIMPIKGSNALAGISSAVNLLQNTRHSSGHIILITDGVETSQLNAILNVDKLNLYQLSILGVGTKQGAPIPLANGSFLKDSDNAIVIPKLNATPLKKLAHKLGGQYVQISTDDTDINTLNRSILHNNPNTETKKTTQQFDTWQDKGPWLVLLCLPLISLSFRKGWLGMLVLTSVLASASKPQISEASVWDDLWTRKDQQGQQAFNQQDYEKAAKLFKNPNWKASALYKQGEYEAAAELFKSTDKQQDPEALYNQGNALAKSGQLQEALNRYEKVLATNPNHKDAEHNYNLVSKLLKNQDSQQKNQNGSNDQSSSDEENQQSQKQNQQDQQTSQQNQEQHSQQNKQQSGEQENDKNSQKNKQQADNNEQAAVKNQQQTQDQYKSEDEKTKWQETSDLKRSEQQQALEQWLRRIPDDPGDLLQRKFYLQSLENGPQESAKPW